VKLYKQSEGESDVEKQLETSEHSGATNIIQSDLLSQGLPNHLLFMMDKTHLEQLQKDSSEL
jgi:hypothetical protein